MGFGCGNDSTYAAVDLVLDFAKAYVVWVNSESSWSAMIVTSGNSNLKSSVLRFSCKIPKIVARRIRDSWISTSME